MHSSIKSPDNVEGLSNKPRSALKTSPKSREPDLIEIEVKNNSNASPNFAETRMISSDDNSNARSLNETSPSPFRSNNNIFNLKDYVSMIDETAGLSIPNNSFEDLAKILQRASRVENELRCRISSLERDIEVKTDEIQKLQHSNSRISHDATEIQEQMESLLVGRVDAESRIDTLQKAHHLHLDELMCRMRKLLIAQREIFGAELGRLQTELSTLQLTSNEKLKIFKEILIETKTKAEMMLDRFKASEERITEVQRLADERLSSTVSSLRAEFEAETTKLDSLIKELTEHLIVAGKEKDAIQEKWALTQIQMERDFAEKECLLKSNNATLEAQRKGLQENLAEREEDWEIERNASEERLKTAIAGQQSVLNKLHALQEDFTRTVQHLVESETNRRALEDKLLVAEREFRGQKAKCEELEVRLKSEREENERIKKFSEEERRRLMEDMKDTADAKLKREKAIHAKELSEMEEDKRHAEQQLSIVSVELSSLKAAMNVLEDLNAGSKKNAKLWQDSRDIESEARKFAEEEVLKKTKEIELLEQISADALRAEKLKHEDEVEVLSAKIRSLDGNVTKLTNDYNHHIELIATLKERNAALEEENSKMRKSNVEFKAELDLIKNQFTVEQRALQLEISELKDERQRLTEDTRRQIATADAALLAEKESGAAHRERAEKAQSDLVEVVAELRSRVGAEAYSDRRLRQRSEENLAKRTLAYENHLETIEKANRNLTERNDDLIRQVRELERRVEIAENEASECAKRERVCENDMRKQAEGFERTINDLHRRLSSAENQAVHSDIQRAQAEHLVDEIRTKHTDMIYSADLRSRQACAETDAVIRYAEQLQNEWISTELARTSKLLSEVNSAAIRVKEQGIHLTSLPSIMENLTSHCAVLTRHVSDIQRELHDLTVNAALRGGQIAPAADSLLVALGASPSRPLSNASNPTSAFSDLKGQRLLSPSRFESQKILTEGIGNLPSPSRFVLLQNDFIGDLRAKAKIIDATSSAASMSSPARTLDATSSAINAEINIQTLPMAGRKPYVLTSPSSYMSQRYRGSETPVSANKSLELIVPNGIPAAPIHSSASSCTSPSAAFALSALARYRSGASVASKSQSPSWSPVFK
eukprot:GDKJ01016622.1.p1 GENE.GDKJ01016622.1~~GDKJ01016622.1.p1  ORF type:complete len:1118 (+),score=303.96 GDKJ01016622.1:40-3393(+)